MRESLPHKIAKQRLRPGEIIGQPIGESLVIDRASKPEPRISHGAARHRRPDRTIYTVEGIKIRVEVYAHSPLRPDKRAEYMRDGTPVLIVPVPRTETECLAWLTTASPFDNNDNRWLFVPNPVDIIEHAGGSIDEQGYVTSFGNLRCAYPKCEQLALNFESNVWGEPTWVNKQLPLEWDGEQHVDDYRIVGGTLPRFACEEHQPYAASLVMPGGLQWARKRVNESTRFRIRQSAGWRGIRMGTNIISFHPVMAGETIAL